MTQPTKRAAKSVRNMAQPRPPAPQKEIGVGASLPFSVPYKDAWEVLRDEEITVKHLAAMRRTDGQARALFRLITLPIRAALKTATFVPENNIEGGEDEAAFIEQLFTLPASAGGMAVPFNRVIAQMLLAVFDGFAAFELVYWSPDTGPLKDKWTLKKIANRPADTLTFLITENSEFDGFRQKTMHQGRYIDTKIDADVAIYYAANEEEKPFYGESFFQSAYFHWEKKAKLYAIAHVASQRAAVGTRVGKYPGSPTDSEKREFNAALSELTFAQSITVPADYIIEQLREGLNFDFLAYINHHNSQMSKSVLAAFFDDNQGSGGDTTLVDFGRQSDALFLLMLQTIMSEIEEVINQQVIPRFIDWNFDSGRYPKFQFGSLSQEQKNAILEVFKSLATAGQSLTVRPEFVHELEKQVSEELGLEIDWETIEETMAEEAEAAAEQQAAIGGDPFAEGGEQEPAAADGSAAPTDKPLVPANLLPEGFTLSADDEGILALNSLARELLGEAYEVAQLTRGRSHTGVKVVRTAAGAKVYGVPIGTPITRDIAERTAKHGVKGKPYGATRKGKPGSGDGDTNTQRQVYGGKTGAQAQNPGGVVTEPDSTSTPKRTLSHPNAPGVELLEYDDGTVAVRDAQGRMSARQKIQIAKFLKLGWKVARSTTAPKSKPGSSDNR